MHYISVIYKESFSKHSAIAFDVYFTKDFIKKIGPQHYYCYDISGEIRNPLRSFSSKSEDDEQDKIFKRKKIEPVIVIVQSRIPSGHECFGLCRFEINFSHFRLDRR